MLSELKKIAAPSVHRDYIGMFDLTKGFLIIMIVVGHSILDFFKYWNFDAEQSPILGILVKVAVFVLQMLIPPFFLICGYTFKKRSMKVCIKTQLHYFLKPYIYVVAAIALITIAKKILISGSVIEGLKYQVLPYIFGFCPGKREFLGIYMDTIGPIWFFLVFVLATILLNAIMYEQQMWVQVFLVLALSCGGMALKDKTLPFCIQQTMICCGYIYVGMLMKKYKFFEKKMPMTFIITSIIICVFAILFGNIAVSENVWKLGMFDLLASYISGILFVLIFQRINNVSGKISEALRWMGRHIMWFCCIHTVCYITIPWDKFADLFSDIKLLGFIIEVIIQSGIAVVGCKILDVYMKKVKLKKVRKNRSY